MRPSRQVVEHRELFRDVDRVVHQRQRAADDRDLGLAGARDQVRRDQVRRRHHAVGGLVVLVDRDDVEAELLGIDQLVDVGLVLVGALLRIVELVRQHDPGGAMLVPLGHVERAIRHQVEERELHQRVSAYWRMISRAVKSGFSTAGTWPQSGTISTRLPGMPLAPALGVFDREQLVVLAPHDQRAHADAVQPALQRRIEPARLPAELGGGVAAGQRDVGLVVRHRHRQDAVGDRLVVVEVADPFLRVPDEVVAGAACP